MVLEGFSFLNVFYLEVDFWSILIDLELQNEIKFEYICPKIDPKFTFEFKGPILEVLRSILEQHQNVFLCFWELGGARASSEGEGEAKA